MPQIFQVLKCYKCLLFQVHQTKKSNKWICKVCGEKQSVKRHYGTGSAKDCRVHVQKLNNLRGDKDESTFKGLDSENSECEDNVENIPKINKNNQLQSKWLPYVGTEEVNEIKEPIYLDNKEVFLELPHKRKQKQSNHKQKNPKITSGDGIFSNLNNIQHQCVSETKQYSNDNGLDTKTDNRFKSQAKDFLHRNHPKSMFSVISKESKWGHFVEADETIKHDSDHMHYESLVKENEFVQTTIENDNYVCKQKQRDEEEQTDCHQAKNVPCINYDKKCQTSINETLFSLCDDSDLDKVLDF